MRKTTIALCLLMVTLLSYAEKFEVTLSTDNYESPSEGMFRYYVDNCVSGDTITFAVDSVGLDTTIRINNKKITIDGGAGVIIDGNANGRVFNISTFSNVVSLKGLVIQNGSDNDYGGGLYAFLSNSDALRIDSCTFKDNLVYSQYDAQGGAVRTNGGIFTNCQFINNTASGANDVVGGGGVFAVGGKFINCVFAGNSAKYGGGISASATTLVNCTFTQNSVSIADNGGGVSAENACELTNCIIFNNKANGAANNLKKYSSVVTYCALESGNDLVGTNGNIALSETPFLHEGADSLSIKTLSPCVNSGNSLVADLPEKDIVGNNRIFGVSVDMGAYENVKQSIITGTVTIEGGAILANTIIANNLQSDASGNYSITSGLDNFEIGDTIILNAPEGFQFYPKEIIITESDQTINLVAYKGIVIYDFVANQDTVYWNSDTVNVFSDIQITDYTLLINAGTKIKFHGYYGINVSDTGSIIAKGTAENRILFTSADTSDLGSWSFTNGYWKHIWFRDMYENADSSFFEYCNIEFAKGISQYGTESSILWFDSFNKVVLSHSQLSHNEIIPQGGMSSSAGGALRISNTQLTIDNCIFNNNTFDSHDPNIMGGGAAIFAYSAELTLVNCSFDSNMARNSKGGAIHAFASTVNLYNSILYNNNDYYGTNSLAYSDYGDGSCFVVHNCNIEGGNNLFIPVYENCMDANPEYADINSGDFSLAASSPCINAGDNEIVSVVAQTSDIAGNPRVYQDFVDMGAFEYQQDINLIYSGTLQKENGEILTDFELLPGYFTNASGEYSININDGEYNVGDTLRFNEPEGYEFYPSTVMVNWQNQRVNHLVAYKGVVIDSTDNFISDTVWSVDTVNVFASIDITNSLLSIAAGTVVRFHEYCGINISDKGVLQAQGSLTDSIIFTYAHPEFSDPSSYIISNCWSGITFNNASNQVENSLFKYCKLEYAKRDDKGGGLYVNKFNRLSLENCEISNNSGDLGGGMYLYESDIKISNCLIDKNHDLENGGWGPVLGGGGLYLYDSHAQLLGCVVSNNASRFYSGGGMLLRSSNPLIVNCTFVNNDVRVGDKGESIYMYRSTPKVYNTIMYGDNTYQFESYELSAYTSNTVVNNCCVKGGNRISSDNYENNLNQIPVFTDVAQDDFSLQEISPCLDQGNDSLLAIIPESDLAGNRRRMGDHVEIGAFEFIETTLYVNASDAVVNIPVAFETEIFQGTITSWSWDFDADGVEDSNNEMPTYTFTNTGLHTVTLIADITELGEKDTVAVDIMVYDTLVAAFTSNKKVGSIPCTVAFTDTSLNNPQSWFWEFGDGGTSVQENPQHSYLDTGVYTVKLIVANDALSDTIIKKSYIEIVNAYPMKTGTYITDNGFFYDDGGENNTYIANKNDVLTIYPKSDKKALVFDFEMYELEYGDRLTVYDGPSVESDYVGMYYNSPGIIEASNSEGCLTFVFHSTNNYKIDPGWRARIQTNPMWDIHFLAGANGNVNGELAQRVVDGYSTLAVTAVANFGYHFDEWRTVQGDSVSAENPITMDDIDADSTWVAVFEKNMYQVNFTVSGDGYIDGEAEQNVLFEENTTAVLAVENQGYHFAYWDFPGDSINEQNPLIVENISANMTVKAVFERNEYTVSYTSEQGGYLEGDTVQQILYNSSSSQVRARNNYGYYFSHWITQNGDSLTSTNPLYIYPVRSDSNIVASFNKNTYYVWFYSRVGGSVEGETYQQVLYKNNTDTVWAVANQGYHFAYWEYNGENISEENPWVVEDLSESRQYYAVFEKNEYTVSFESTSGGYIEGDSVQSVLYQENSDYVSAMPHYGYHFSNWMFSDSSYATNNNPLKLYYIDQDTSYIARFDKNTYYVTFSTNTGGYLDGNQNQSVLYNENTDTVEAIPSPGYHFVHWELPNDSVVAQNLLVVENVSFDFNVKAIFEKNSFVISYEKTVGGVLVGDTLQNVLYQDNAQQVLAAPDWGYHFKYWSNLDGIVLEYEQALVVRNVDRDSVLVANFEIDTYELQFVSGDGGYIEGEENQSVNYNQNAVAVQAIPNYGYHFIYWELASGGTVHDNPLLIENVVQDEIYTAVFAKNSYAVSFESLEGGYISGNTWQSVLYEETAEEVLAVANQGYSFSHWTAPNSDYENISNPLTVTNVSSDTTLQAVFNLNAYNLVFEATEGGSVSGLLEQTVFYGYNATVVTAIPDEGYYFRYWELSDGSVLGYENELLVENVSQHMDITAVFDVQVFFIHFLATEGGNIYGIQWQEVNYMENTVEVSAIPNDGYYFSHWQNENYDSISAMNPIIIENVISDSTLYAVFNRSMYTVRFNVDSNAYISGDTLQQLYYGENTQQVQVIPDSGYVFSHWETATGDSVFNDNPLVIEYVTTDLTYHAVIDKMVSIGTGQAFAVAVYPNPASDWLTISAEALESISIYSLEGKLCESVVSDGNMHRINIKALEKGVYVLKVHTTNRQQLIRVIKQ